jgi:hypothetical protein
VFDDGDDNWECSDLGYEECIDAEQCEANLNAAGEFEGCIDSDNDWECLDLGYEDCQWYDECVWTDSGCQDANWEDDCNGLSQDECATNEGCEWISDSDNPNNWGMCVEVDNEDGPPECLLDCEGIEYINPDENPYEACDWIISTFGFDPGFASCFNDCDEETVMLIYTLVEGCYNCLEDSTLDCADVFDDGDDNLECSDIDNPYECNSNEDCEWQPNPTGSGQCIEGDSFEPVCEDLSEVVFESL